MRWILTSVIIWRILLFFIPFIGDFFLIFRTDYTYINLWRYIAPYAPVTSVFFYPWANFDGVHYLSIAGKGYDVEGRFFPLFPFLIHGVSFLFSPKPFDAISFFTSLFVANICFFLSLIVFYTLIRLDYTERVGKQTILTLLLFPTAFFFAAIYSESLFLLLTLLTFYFLRTKRFLWAGIAAMCVTATRVVGIAILPVIVYEYYRYYKSNPKLGKQKRIVQGLPLLLSPLGIAAYMLYSNWKWHDPLYFIHAQGMLENGRSVNSFVFPLQTLYRYIKILTINPINQYEWWIALLELVTFFFVCSMLYLAWKKGVRFSYLLFAIGCFLIPTLSGTFSGLPRYAAVLFPIYIVIGLLKNKKLLLAIYSASGILLFLLLILFSKGYYVA